MGAVATANTAWGPWGAVVALLAAALYWYIRGHHQVKNTEAEGLNALRLAQVQHESHKVSCDTQLKLARLRQTPPREPGP